MKSEEETTKAVKIISDALDAAVDLNREKIKSLVDGYADDFYQAVVESIYCDASFGIEQHIRREVKNRITKIIKGDLDAIKDADILSEYSYGDIHAMRMKIWETCSESIEKHLITSLQEDNKRYKEWLEIERRYR